MTKRLRDTYEFIQCAGDICLEDGLGSFLEIYTEDELRKHMKTAGLPNKWNKWLKILADNITTLKKVDSYTRSFEEDLAEVDDLLCE